MTWRPLILYGLILAWLGTAMLVFPGPFWGWFLLGGGVACVVAALEEGWHV